MRLDGRRSNDEAKRLIIDCTYSGRGTKRPGEGRFLVYRQSILAVDKAVEKGVA